MDNQNRQQEQATTIVKQLCHAYLSTQDIDKVLHYVDYQILWIASERNQICRGHGELKALLQEKVSIDTEANHIIEEWYEAIPLTANTCTVYGEMKLADKLNPPYVQEKHVRFSFVCSQDERELKILQAHTSLDIQGEEDGQYQSALTAQQQVNDRLQQAVIEKTEELERIYEEYHENLARYRFALEVTNDVAFELDLKSKQIHLDDRRFFDLVKRNPERGYYTDIKEDLLRIVHPDDREEVNLRFSLPYIMAMAKEGNEILSCECRIQNMDKNYVWILGQMTPIKDSQGRVVKLIGNIKNIDDRVRKQVEVSPIEQKDSLTGLLDKESTESAIQLSIGQAEKEESGAMFLIDINDFKGVNDKMGRLYGDAVLSYFTAELIKIFRSTDIVGRVGGDEFLVFFLGSPTIDVIESKAAQICKIFRDSGMEEQQMDRASISLGVALFPEQGSTYQELFKKAEDALQEAKNRGKDQYCFY